MFDRYPGLAEIPRREPAWIAFFLLTFFCVALSGMVALPGPSPVAFKILALTFGLLDLIPIWVLLFPRTYLAVDLLNRSATFVEPGGSTVMPLADLEPLYVFETDAGPRRGEGRVGRVRWFTVRSAAAPVMFHRGADRAAAEKRLARLTRKFGFTRTAPSKHEYVKA